MLIHRLKILLSIIISLAIVQGITYFSENPLPNTREIAKLFTFNLSPNQGSTVGIIDSRNNFFQLEKAPTTAPSTSPTPSTETVEQTDLNEEIPVPTVQKSTTPTSTPTPKPTSKPKPTATPKPAAITSDTRPGTSMEAIFQEVSKRQCIPAALLHAFQTQESGPFFSYNASSSTIKIYNTYGWWITGKGDPCYGLGYHTQTGIVPQDSVRAGEQCRNAVQPDAYDQGIMGIIQIGKAEQDGAYKYLKDTFPKNYDRRVLFDNAMIFAVITKNRLGNPPKNCNDWPDDAIKTAAEKHYGSCADNYCNNVLKYYKQYK